MRRILYTKLSATINSINNSIARIDISLAEVLARTLEAPDADDDESGSGNESNGDQRDEPSEYQETADDSTGPFAS